MAIFDVFAEIIRAHGDPEHRRVLTRNRIRELDGQVPPGLMLFLAQHGSGSYGKGKFWIPDPALLNPVVDRILADDPEYHPSEIRAIGYYAFGDMVLWGKKDVYLYVTFEESEIFDGTYDPALPTRPELANAPPSPPDFGVGLALQGGIESDDDGPYDAAGEMLFPQALAKLGQLSPGEIYGFVPALNFGGEPKLENVRRLGLIEHLLFLTQITTFKLTRLYPATDTQPFGVKKIIRNIGSAAR